MEVGKKTNLGYNIALSSHCCPTVLIGFSVAVINTDQKQLEGGKSVLPATVHHLGKPSIT